MCSRMKDFSLPTGSSLAGSQNFEFAPEFTGIVFRLAHEVKESTRDICPGKNLPKSGNQKVDWIHCKCSHLQHRRRRPLRFNRIIVDVAGFKYAGSFSKTDG